MLTNTIGKPHARNADHIVHQLIVYMHYIT